MGILKIKLRGWYPKNSKTIVRHFLSIHSRFFPRVKNTFGEAKKYRQPFLNFLEHKPRNLAYVKCPYLINSAVNPL